MGISRTKEKLEQATIRLDRLEKDLASIGVGNFQREYSITWQDWINLRNLILVSKVITASALARENSRGAHYRDDFPDPGPMEGSYFTAVSINQNGLQVENRAVVFSLVKPGESLLN